MSYMLGMTLRSSLIPLFLLLFLPVAAQELGVPSGCDCPTVRLDDDYCASSVVFEGRALRSDTLPALEATGRYGSKAQGRVRTRFQVQRVLKGGEAKELSIVTGTKADDCAFHFVTGQPYLVFARQDDDGLQTHQCTHTRALDTVTREFLDSLDQVVAGRGWDGGMPVKKPCP